MNATSALSERTTAHRLLRTRTGIVLATVVAAVVLNLAIYLLGIALGATYRFTSQGQPATVDALTLVGFTAVPMSIGMGIAGLLPSRWRWVTPTAVAVTVLVGLGSIVAMPLSTDLDAASRIALSLCHVAVTLTTCVGLLALRSARRPAGPGEQATAA